MPLGQQQGSGGKDRYCAENDDQRPQRRYLKPAGRNHLPADEGQYCGQAVMQQMQPMQKSLQNEVERPQSQDGEDVRGVDDKRIVGHAQYGGHRVDGEDHVGDFDCDNSEQHRRHAPAAALHPVRDGWRGGPAFLLAHYRTEKVRSALI